MLLTERIEVLEEKIDLILDILGMHPDWYPLSLNLANRVGYKSVDGLRKWCTRNIHPDYFRQIGKTWHIHRTKLPYLQQTQVKYKGAGSRQS